MAPGPFWAGASVWPLRLCVHETCPHPISQCSRLPSCKKTYSVRVLVSELFDASTQVTCLHHSFSCIVLLWTIGNFIEMRKRQQNKVDRVLWLTYSTERHPQHCQGSHGYSDSKPGGLNEERKSGLLEILLQNILFRDSKFVNPIYRCYWKGFSAKYW